MSVINSRTFGRLWPVSWTITHRFGVPDRTPRLTNPGVRLRVGHQYSRFLSILTHSMDYHSPFWGPKAISMVLVPQGAIMCRSTTLAVFADSGPFHGLLLTVLAPRAISTINDTRGAFTCRSSTLVVLADSGPYRGLLLTVLGSRGDFHD